MLQTTLLEVITLLEKKLLIFALTELESLLTSALVSKDSLYSTQLEEVLDLVLDLSFLKDFLLIMERNQSLDSLYILHLKFQQL